MDIRPIWEKLCNQLRQRDNQAGLYLTVSFHLILLIVFLSYSIQRLIPEEVSFVFDFTGIEQEEEIKRMEEIKKSVVEEIDALLAKSSQTNVRNTAVDAYDRNGERLKDDRSKNPSDVYDEARRLQAKLDASRREALQNQDSNEDVALEGAATSKNQEKYVGASVISYRLKDRKALDLKVPAYKCQGAGDVTVAIIVNRKGYVKTARIVHESSSTDQCLQEYAIKAAERSRFTAAPDAPEKQAGEIVYRFIAQ